MTRSAAHDRAAWAVGAAFLLLYGFTAAPGLLHHDSGEFQTVAILGGIPHSSGYPLWIALAHAFTWLPLGAPEFRVTLFSAVCGAAALALFVRRLGDVGVPLAASVVAACFLGTSFSFWRVSVRAEVYALSVLMALVAFGALLRARTAPPADARAARIAGFLLGLVLTVHLDFAPAVAVAGLALAVREMRAAPDAGAAIARAALLLLAFLAGLTPYLLIPALDASGAKPNFIDMVRHAKSMMPPGGPPIDSPWGGTWWLVTGRNVYPPSPMEFHPRSLVDGFVQGGVMVVLFELGPAGALLALAGFVRRWRRDRVLAALLVLGILATMVLAAVIQHGAMLQLFQLPGVVIAAFFVADGIDALMAAAGRPRAARAAALGVMVWALLTVPPALIRARAEARPIGGRGLRVIEEDPYLRSGLLPTMRDNPVADDWGRAALAAFPRDALVLASWAEFTPLRHLRLVHGARPDLTLDQIAVETLPRRILDWQRTHDLARAPIVVVAPGAREAPYVGDAETIPLANGAVARVIRRPLDERMLHERIAAAAR